ncbi:hypothetical protein Taro_043631 [Colocasia esculenta]|uniref:Uncharacterized protein n=1 Tax=Colocasia esculenta TaxID=4460 RepID=A0A843WGY2_COLES|nr:hypothetical protein [Colocasia esculenta]
MYLDKFHALNLKCYSIFLHRLGVGDMDVGAPPEERMIQLSTPSLDSESGSTSISAKEAFISVMGKD